MCRPRLPVVFTKERMPSSSSIAFVRNAPSLTMSKVTPGEGSRSIRSSSATSGVAAR